MLILAAVLAAVATATAAQVPVASSYDPVHAGEVPPGYYQSVPRGAIRAVYEPEFMAGIHDPESNTVWDATTGLVLRGASGSQPLLKIPALTSFPRDFLTFWPEGRFWTEPH